jgi:hypothetical protein
MLKCQFCEKEFQNISSFNLHQRTAKYCLEKQGKENIEYQCKYCKKFFTNKQRLETHLEICSVKLSESSKKIKDLEIKIKELEKLKTKKDKIIEKLEKEKVKELEKLESKKDKIIENLELKNKELEDKLYKILEKAIDKPTTTNNTTNIEKLEMISKTFLDEKAQYLTIDHIKNGADGYANFFLEHQLKDRVICTDFSRRKIKYKDENGEVITDPEMNSLSLLLFNSIKSRNQQLTIKYMDELINKEKDQEYFMKIAQNFGEQDLEFAKILNGQKNGMYHDILRRICSVVLI